MPQYILLMVINVGPAMRTKPRHAVPWLLLVPLAAAPATAATTQRGQLSVDASVQSGCSLSGAAFNFGQYTSGQPANLDAVGTIAYADCTGSVTLELDGGLSGDVNARQLRAGSRRLGYQIYRDASRTAVWGRGTEARTVRFSTSESGRIEVFGRIPGGAVVEPGTYTDTIAVTLTF
jgi:spore coat protein U-like protein